jgi:hypothetical protein
MNGMLEHIVMMEHTTSFIKHFLSTIFKSNHWQNTL